MEKVYELNNSLYYLLVSFLFFIEHDSCEYGSVKYYIYCALSGMLSCGLTHTALVPLVGYSFSYLIDFLNTNIGSNQMSFTSQTSKICESH